MKIFVVLPYLTNIGGAARYAWELSEFLAKRGDDIIIVSLYTDKKLYNSEHVKIIDLADSSNLTQSIKFWINLKKISNKLSDLINIEKPDLVLFNHFPSTLWVKKYPGIPILCYPQDIELLYSDTYTQNLSSFSRIVWRFLRLFVRYYDKKQWKNFDQVICNSNFSALRISEKYNVEPLVIYPGTDTNVFSPIQKNLNEKTILLIADHKTRRADFFLQNVNQLLKKRQDFQIWVVGSTGLYENELKELVKKCHIEKFVTFFGRVSDSKLRELYAKAHIFIHLQRIHPFGLVFIEAMSCGTPVIGCMPGATEEIIKNGETGFLISENDHIKLFENVEKILDNPELSVSMGLQGRERVKQNFELSDQYEKIRNVMIDWIKRK